MSKPRTMNDVIRALREDGIRVQDASCIKIGDKPAFCRLCGHNTKRTIRYFPRNAIFAPVWRDICADRPACRQRQADAKAKREREVLGVVEV